MPSTATDRLNGLTTSVAVKAPCRVAALTNITLSGEQTVNGVAVVEGDRVLVTAQTSSVDNGIYKVSTSDWTRALDFDGNRDVVQGTIVPVVNGAGTEDLYTVTSANPITIDTTALTFQLRYGANIRYDRTAAEIAAGVTPTDYAYPPGDVRRYGAVGDGVTNCTTAIQNAILVCQADTQYGGIAVRIPGGRYLVDDTLTISKQFITIVGDGMWESQIYAPGLTTAILTTTAIQYLRPIFKDFALVDPSGSGKGLDLSVITGQVYLGEISNLYLESGDDAFYAKNFFSMVVQNVSALSRDGHSFRASCGPGVSWISCYALTAGAGKAGFRMIGGINLFACNGLNDGDYWGVFGNDLASADGFQVDFSTDDYPDINLYGCNVEHFGSLSTAGEGIRVQNSFRCFNIIGGKFDRDSLSTAYSAIIRCRAGSNGGLSSAHIGVGSIFLGSGSPSNSHLYADTATVFCDVTNQLRSVGITTFKVGGTTYPVLEQYAVGDVAGDYAFYQSAVSPRRLTTQMVMHKTTTLTPVGSNQAINVTGYTKVTVTPASAASISTATFSATPGTADDNGRNGDLIIEAGNGNLTINHSASGGNTFRLAAGSNLSMSAGQVVRFCRSETGGNWWQV